MLCPVHVVVECSKHNVKVSCGASIDEIAASASGTET